MQGLIDIQIDTSERVPDPTPPRIPLRQRAREAIAALSERVSRALPWAGRRPDLVVPSAMLSLVSHALLLGVLAMFGYAAQQQGERRFESVAVDTNISDAEPSKFQDIDQSAEPPSLMPAAGSFSPNLATVNVAPTATNSMGALLPQPNGTAGLVDLAKLDVRRATDSVVPTASMLSQNVSIKGNGSEHVGSTEGAVDRLAEEILRRLEKGRTLVVWAFDASGSLQAERERLAKHIETVYAHLSQLDGQNKSADSGLLTQVIAFGQDRKAMTDRPTADPAEITRAIREVPLDATGVETTFQTVAEIVRRWGRYKDSKGNAYRTMVIVVTDEVGDDEAYLEDAVAIASQAKVPVYVLGNQAVFGRSEGRMNYTDPNTGKTFYNLPVRQGPESVALEQVRLPFWYGGDQYEFLDSGFGPYALSRLAEATGGIYFVTRLGQTRMGFDPAALREYKPDWVSRARYEDEVGKHPIRRAVITAAQKTQQRQLPGMPRMVFPPADGPEFKEAMSASQAQAAETTYVVDDAIAPINAVAGMRNRETSRRWQAQYDLTRGRLLAMQVRSEVYNRACGKMKKDAPKFTNPDSNAWRLVPDPEILYANKALTAAASQAVELLKKVVAEHPNTPWALLAQRELKDPLGFKWVEARMPPTRRNNNNNDNNEAARKKAANMPKPQEPPKL